MKSISKLLVFTLFILLNFGIGLSAAQKIADGVEIVDLHSAAMNKSINSLVIVPANYDKDSSKHYPVVYLLHGHGGSFRTWYGIRPELKEIATLYGMIIVCPDGAVSWYWDSPVNQTVRYETYITSELVPFIDKMYRTIPEPSKRAISGFSMGGHGAMWLTLRHQDLFGACGILSGGVDIRPFPNNWNMKDSLGEYAERPEVWEAHTCINQIDKIKDGLSIYIDCGSEDFFFNVNRNLHDKLLAAKVPHEYIVRPGKHDGKYWRNAIDYQMMYFDKFFKKN